MAVMGTAVGDAALDRLRDLGLSGELRRLELPGPHAAGPWLARRPTRKAILANLFYVHSGEARLEPPIDWAAGPARDGEPSRSARFELHSLTWLNEALARHAAGGDVEALAVARDIVLDWCRAHLRERPGDGDGAGADGAPAAAQSEFAWYDMAAGLRAPYVAYVLRACLAEDMLDAAAAELLLEAAERHGAELAAGRNYAAANNHGLFQDEGLYLLARLLPALPAADAWRELAVNRDAHDPARDGLLRGRRPPRALHRLPVRDPRPRRPARRATSPSCPSSAPCSAACAAPPPGRRRPAGRMAQLGDTDDVPAPDWARDTAARLRGLRVLPRGGPGLRPRGRQLPRRHRRLPRARRTSMPTTRASCWSRAGG